MFGIHIFTAYPYPVFNILNVEIAEGEMSVQGEEQSHLIHSKWFARFVQIFLTRESFAL